ncbi:hypothetical protein HJC23_009233, partial [Cyclotella cryptica]
ACVRDWNEERGRLVDALNSKVGNAHEERVCITMAKSARDGDGGVYNGSYAYPCGVVGIVAAFSYCCFGGKPKDSAGSHEAAVEVKADPTSSHTHYTYTFLVDSARLLPRYP